ncbi:hypothetical protein Pla52n_13840 [Stieleria varia]|uniref:Uncharacterized protein n=1 Tax=Stieleria varia TaxID=2528005 RepID=A0A5C6B2L9_9BACT|nr:hypothetical protein Pla52n_13840 [Stieleria varia]
MKYGVATLIFRSGMRFGYVPDALMLCDHTDCVCKVIVHATA